MGDGVTPRPGNFEEALAAAFGERASDFSPELREALRTLYQRGRRDGRRAQDTDLWSARAEVAATRDALLNLTRVARESHGVMLDGLLPGRMAHDLMGLGDD